MTEHSKPKLRWTTEIRTPKQPEDTIGLYIECDVLWKLDAFRYKTRPAFGVYLTYRQVGEMTDSAELQDYVISRGGFAENLTDAQYEKMVKAIPDKFLKDECFERGIEVNPFERED